MDKEHGPIEQLRIACRNPSASLLGAAIGGFVPVATYTVAHQQLHVGGMTQASTWTPAWALVGGGLLYSAKTVWQWGRLTFNDRWKATGFVLLVEGVMVCSPVVWLSRAALLYLLAINAIATACLLAVRDQADARSSGRDESAHEPDDDLDPPSRSRPVATKLLSAPGGKSRRGRPAEAPDALYQRAMTHVRDADGCSISQIQRELNVGYNVAAKLVARMEREGRVGPEVKGGGRRVVKLAQLELSSPARQLSPARAGASGGQ